MNAIRIDIEGLEEMRAAWAQAPEITRKELAAAMAEADTLLEKEVKDATPTGASGGGASGIKGSIYGVEQVSETGVIGIVGTAQKYALPVEFGSKPHWPRFEIGPDKKLHCYPLEDWVHAKRGVSGKEARSIAFLIARKISRTGTQGAFMFTKTFKREEPAVQAIFSQARDRIAAHLSGGTA